MNPNFNLFTGSAQVHLGGAHASLIELLIEFRKNLPILGSSVLGKVEALGVNSTLKPDD